MYLSTDVCILFSYFFVLSYQFLRDETYKQCLTFPYSYNWQKFNNKMNEKRSQEYQNMGPKYITGQINSCILELLLR